LAKKGRKHRSNTKKATIGDQTGRGSEERPIGQKPTLTERGTQATFHGTEEEKHSPAKLIKGAFIGSDRSKKTSKGT
jgi:hypothetical protein